MKIIIAISLVMLAAASQAATWTKTFSNEIAVEYVDIDSIQRNGSKISANFKRDYTDGVVRKSKDAAGKYFEFKQSRSVQTFECSGDQHAIDQLWDVSADGAMRSPTVAYPMTRNNDTWDAAAKNVVCR